ncbi:HlyD family type I secretion periplasmic adaptor subunit [Lichenihabitans psoromatis]|uniref:HlyD family type I secretion periplasmic adaptor subunit n=1 Tax=Lichenihabitans psoromatis TaxID=2528642 RepID=UPI0010364E86|nr:HlyD family type I secretion periplasmic adaptor subunit [Lichenihabitans psoromatis]
MSRSNARALQTVRQWQSETDSIREAAEPTGARWAVFALAGLFVCLLGATPFLSLDRVIGSEHGKIVSTESVTTYQALDTSLIKTIDVKEGQQVEAGQLLATLDPTFTTADVGQLKQQVASLDAQIARAKAEMNHTPMVMPATLSKDEIPYYALQKGLLDQHEADFAAQMRSFDEKMKTTGATITKLQGDELHYQEREKIAKQVETMRDTLYKSGSSSLLNLLQANDASLEMKRTREFGQNSLIEAQHQLSSLKADRDAFVQQRSGTLSQEIVTAQNSLDSSNAQLQKATKHQDLVRLVAKEPSVVLTLSRLSVGSVLKEGDPVMTLMNAAAPVEAEVQISSKDVGYIRAGDHCVLKIDAFNYSEHGSAKGTLMWVSENAFTLDDDGKPADPPYYKARVRIDSMNFSSVPQTFRLIPGMTLKADISVGKRSVLEYVLGGFFRTMGEAMREP